MCHVASDVSTWGLQSEVIYKGSSRIEQLQKRAKGKKGQEQLENVDESEKRNKAKKDRFWELKDSLPTHIQDMFDNASKSTLGKRKQQTKIINELFTKGDSGEWVLDTTKPMFGVTNVRSDRKEGMEMKDSLPRVLMVEKFREGEEGLKRAIAKGQLFEFNLEGIEMVGYKKVSSARVSSQETRTDTKKARGRT